MPNIKCPKCQTLLFVDDQLMVKIAYALVAINFTLKTRFKKHQKSKLLRNHKDELSSQVPLT